MKAFHCACGQEVFFDSEHCLACGAELGFYPATMRIEVLKPGAATPPVERTPKLKRCANSVEFDVCNWLLDADDPHDLCLGCRFNRTVPNQSLPGNQQRWRRLEESKKRLLFTLIQLGVPLENGWDAPDTGLLMDFIEDERSAGPYSENFVHTGYLGGIITINALEADDAARESHRLQMNESYRTVLGHLRHESGHYYWQRLDPDGNLRSEFRAVFGDDTLDYSAALERYYAEGPSPDWQEHFISAYASAHPTEDWAESWGHYLHIYDALDTASTHGLTTKGPEQMTINERIGAWRKLSVTLNELNRSVGRRDAYPFVLNREVEAKLTFVDGVIRQLQTLPRATVDH